mmetsp:Transcript_150342/g.262696  ORF Transcript_150342/g.262696 Transcript_150342/m.262696 type:complete len:270 (-) Transcript_150342:105-914(-)
MDGIRSHPAFGPCASCGTIVPDERTVNPVSRSRRIFLGCKMCTARWGGEDCHLHEHAGGKDSVCQEINGVYSCTGLRDEVNLIFRIGLSTPLQSLAFLCRFTVRHLLWVVPLVNWRVHPLLDQLQLVVEEAVEVAAVQPLRLERVQGDDRSLRHVGPRHQLQLPDNIAWSHFMDFDDVAVLVGGEDICVPLNNEVDKVDRSPLLDEEVPNLILGRNEALLHLLLHVRWQAEGEAVREADLVLHEQQGEEADDAPDHHPQALGPEAQAVY